MLRALFFSSLIALLPLLLVFSIFTFVNASVSLPTELQIIEKIKDEIIEFRSQKLPDEIDDELQRVITWMAQFRLKKLDQDIPSNKKSRKRKNDEMSTVDEEIGSFKSIVKKFLTTIQSFVEQRFFFLLQDNGTVTYVLQLVINDSLNKLDRVSSFKGSEALNAMKLFKDVIKSFLSLLGPVAPTFNNVTFFAARFELFLQVSQSGGGPNFAYFQRLWMIRYQIFAKRMMENCQIYPNLSGLFSLEPQLMKQVDQVLQWQSKLKDLFRQTTEIQYLAVPLKEKQHQFEQQFKNIKKQSLKLWIYTHQFLSTIHMKLMRNQFDKKFESLRSFINIFKSLVRSFIHSPNFMLLSKAHDVKPVDETQIKVLHDFVSSLKVFSCLIKSSSDLFPPPIFMGSKIKIVMDNLKILRLKFRKDCLSYLSMLESVWLIINCIPNDSFTARLSTLGEKFDKLAITTSYDEIRRFIDKMQEIVKAMKQRMEKYTNEMQKPKFGKLLFVDVSHLTVKDSAIWRPVNLWLISTLRNTINSAVFADHIVDVEHEIESIIAKLKIKEAMIAQKIQSKSFTFDEVLEIMNHSANLIKVISFVQTHKLSKAQTLRLKSTLATLIKRVGLQR